MEMQGKTIPFVCPVCHHTTKGKQRDDGAVIVICHRCKATIFSKRHEKQLLIKATLK